MYQCNYCSKVFDERYNLCNKCGGELKKVEEFEEVLDKEMEKLEEENNECTKS